jgi:crotonobetainyl-CoA:carnitine CoA-transferase CaiB-like acyl-CoA transferase
MLEGLVVLDMGTFITGPACGMLLADMGADVIKIERPGTGDPFREYQGSLYATHFQTYNRNKRSVTLDTRDPDDLAALDRLIAGADVFIQNFRPGVADKLNVGAERLRLLNPRLIYCAISGFGASGPERDRPAFDTVAQAASGFLRLLINPAAPRVVGPAIADAVTGFYGAMGVLAALHERNRSGKGHLVETSMFEAMCHFNLDDFSHFFSDDTVMNPFTRPSVSQSYVFECQDGLWIALHMSSPVKFWENLATAVGDPGMMQRAEYRDRDARIANYDTVVADLAAHFRTAPLAIWEERLRAGEVPHSRLASPPDVVASPQAKHLGIEVSAEHPLGGIFRTIRSPLSFDGKASSVVTAPPLLGAHNKSILGRGD